MEKFKSFKEFQLEPRKPRAVVKCRPQPEYATPEEAKAAFMAAADRVIKRHKDTLMRLADK